MSIKLVRTRALPPTIEGKARRFAKARHIKNLAEKEEAKLRPFIMEHLEQAPDEKDVLAGVLFQVAAEKEGRQSISLDELRQEFASNKAALKRIEKLVKTSEPRRSIRIG